MNSLIDYLLKSAAFLTVFFGFYWLLLRKETYFVLNRVYLISTAIVSFILPFLHIPSPFRTFEVTAAVPVFVASAGPPSEPGFDLARFLILIYVAGAAMLLLRLMIRFLLLMTTVRKCGKERRGRMRIVLLDHSGATFSFFKYIFLERSAMTEEDLPRIMAHEMVHIRQHHSMDLLFSEILTIVQWFNPVVWPYKKALRETHEYLADRGVITQGCSLTQYQLLIVEQHVGGKLYGFASQFKNSEIKRRLTMLSKQESHRSSRLKPLLILPLALMLVLAFAQSRPVQTTQEEMKAEATTTDEEQQINVEELKKMKMELEKFKQENEIKIRALKEKYAASTSDEEKQKIKQLLEQQRLTSLKINGKELYLKMQLIKLKLDSTEDPDQAAELKKALEETTLKTKDLEKKLKQMIEAQKAEIEAQKAEEEKKKEDEKK